MKVLEVTNNIQVLDIVRRVSSQENEVSGVVLYIVLEVTGDTFKAIEASDTKIMGFPSRIVEGLKVIEHTKAQNVKITIIQ